MNHVFVIISRTYTLQAILNEYKDDMNLFLFLSTKVIIKKNVQQYQIRTETIKKIAEPD